ncbi:type II toxin-antitoxin system death-on-curing family toxin [Methyloglobulus sp.]|uniref:type II toxin-antitoxin system death-on-curing family toxin n=1 Tax=Methyloglobulus sp. TaxID=2518622 RepID=UPI0032B7470C
MIEPIWIELEETLLIHSRLLQKYGGSDGIRDSGLLHSALAKPKQFLYYTEATTLPDLAAAYMSGIVKNHPFIDGNKRVGFGVGVLFLGLNGLDLKADPIDAANVILELAAGKMDSVKLTDWLVANL